MSQDGYDAFKLNTYQCPDCYKSVWVGDPCQCEENAEQEEED